MSQDLTKKKFVPGSLRGPRTARTLLLRMAADDARAQRIRDTYEQRKAENPREYTWRRLADHVGISERAVQDWPKTGGVDYNHAKRAAEFWNVDFDWLWRGPKEGTPDPFAGAARADQVDDGFDEFRQYVRDIRRDIAENRQLLEEARSERQRVADLVERQEGILRRIEALASGLPTDDALEAFRIEIERAEARVAAEAAAERARASTAGRASRRRASEQ
jgi:hypothetical protein